MRHSVFKLLRRGSSFLLEFVLSMLAVKVNNVEVHSDFFLVLVFQQETTLFLQLLYQNNFKDDFSFSLKDRYEHMIISAVHDREYMENYKHLDMNLDRGMHAHFQLHSWYFLILKMLRLSYLKDISFYQHLQRDCSILDIPN